MKANRSIVRCCRSPVVLTRLGLHPPRRSFLLSQQSRHNLIALLSWVRRLGPFQIKLEKSFSLRRRKWLCCHLKPIGELMRINVTFHQLTLSHLCVRYVPVRCLSDENKPFPIDVVHRRRRQTMETIQYIRVSHREHSRLN